MQIIQNFVCHCLVKDSLVTVALQIEFKRLKLNTNFVWAVFKVNSCKVRLTGYWANAGEFVTDVLDDVGSTCRVRKSFNLSHFWLQKVPA